MANSNKGAHSRATFTNAKPHNPLIDEHTVDTLTHIQEVLMFLQDYMFKYSEDADMALANPRVNTGHYTLLRLVNDALEYEINRSDQADSSRVMN